MQPDFMCAGKISSVESVLQEHLAYRMTHLDGLVWAAECLLGTPRSGSIVLHFEGQASMFMLTNPLFEVGTLNCRLVMDFLGIRIDKGNRLAPVLPRRPDDLGVEDLGLPPVTVSDFLKCGPTQQVESSTIKMLIAADKGVAHFTVNPGGRAWAPDALVCADAVMACVDRYVYKALGKPVAGYRRWTAGMAAMRGVTPLTTT